MKKIFFTVSLFLLLFAIPCDAAQIKTIQLLQPSSKTLTKGGWLNGHQAGEIKITPSEAAGNNLRISSSAPSILSAKAGAAKGFGIRALHISPLAPGNATLTIKDEVGGYETTFSFQVKAASSSSVYVSEISISYASSVMAVGDERTPTFTISPDNVSDPELIWQSDTPDVVSVDEKTGKITALKQGTAGITAESTDGSARSSNAFVVSVLDPPAAPSNPTYVPVTSLIVSGPSEIKIGETAQMQALITPDNATLKDAVSWFSSNTTVAAVDRYGQVTAYSKGTATIGAKISEQYGTTTKYHEASVGILVVDSNNNDSTSSGSGGCNATMLGFAVLCAAFPLLRRR
ncbi:Ig-like domain-containing protein [Synergistaceae bacterium OttesenSCG-928-I11]|nr:Ig-like domain-containing protein [Synergistaceae bacterium OttesenSCG-928-I11]